jgi:hypothetical protein
MGASSKAALLVALAIGGAVAIGTATVSAVTAACGGSDTGASSAGATASSGRAGASGGAGSSGSSGASGNGASSGSDGSSGTSGGVAGPGTTHAGCRIFPDDNPWNRDVSSDPLDGDLMSTVFPSMALGTGLHPDWGTESDRYGIPITVGKGASPAPITWSTTYGPRESDKLPCPTGSNQFCYPVPLDAKIEGGPGAAAGTDRHILFLANDGAPGHCVLYELFNAQNPTGGGFTAASGAIWKLDSNALRTEGWTSADAAGLSVFAGLVRWEEIQRGVITHALRFTMDASRHAYIHPATHAAGDESASLPPMGLRVRLKASFDDSALTGPSKIITTAMKRYGLVLADNGSSWYISGESNDAWGPAMDALLSNLRKVKGSDFEIVKTGPVIIPPP